MKEMLLYRGEPIPVGARVRATANGNWGTVQSNFADNSLENHERLKELVPVLFDGEAQCLGICGTYARHISQT